MAISIKKKKKRERKQARNLKTLIFFKIIVRKTDRWFFISRAPELSKLKQPQLLPYKSINLSQKNKLTQVSSIQTRIPRAKIINYQIRIARTGPGKQ